MSNSPSFDTRAKNALASAQQAAIKLRHKNIGSEHLLYGVLSEKQDDLPFQIALISHSSPDDLLNVIKKYHETNFKDTAEKSDHKLLPDVTSEFQNCLDAAIRAAEQYNYNYIGIEHLLYGILITEESNGLKLMNISPAIKQELLKNIENIFNINKAKISGDPTEMEEIKAGMLNQMPGAIKKGQSVLKMFGTNLNKKVADNKEYNLVARDSEIARMVEILTRKNKNNPIVLGDAGVGKTALVEGLVKKINDKEVPLWLQNKIVYDLDIASMLAGSVFRGDFEQRVKQVIEEVIKMGNVILFIDEIHNTIGAGGGGSSDKGPDMSNLLKPALARGEVSVIGATTEDEYRKIIKKDKAFERRFQALHLDEPSKEQVLKILEESKGVYEQHHQVIFPNDLLEKLVDLADRFVSERKFPDKAFDVLDEALVKTKIKFNKTGNEKDLSIENSWNKIEDEIINLITEKNQAVLNLDNVKAEFLRKKQQKLEKELTSFYSSKKEVEKYQKVDQKILEEVISQMSGVPLMRISSDIYTQISHLEEQLNMEIFGQEDAIKIISKALKRSYSGVNPNKGPIASFLLLGPTGVGKTETVKVLTKNLYGDPSKYLLTIDMSEMKEKHSMSRLLGAPAGYVGYDDAPQLTEFLRKRPYSVILFDEIEKGHPDNLNILLQMLDEGRVTDAKGNTFSCENTIIFLTSNLGKNQFNKFASKLGFLEQTDREKEDYEQLVKQINGDVEKNIKPEILGRLTSRIIYRPISQNVLKKIISKELRNLQNHMFKQGRTVTFEKMVVDFVAEKAEERFEYGAREIRSLVADKVQTVLAEFLLEQPKSNKIKLTINKDKIFVK